MSGILALCDLASGPDMWETAVWFFETAGVSVIILVPSVFAIIWADVKLKKMNSRYSYDVNWKRDGF